MELNLILRKIVQKNSLLFQKTTTQIKLISFQITQPTIRTILIIQIIQTSLLICFQLSIMTYII